MISEHKKTYVCLNCGKEKEAYVGPQSHHMGKFCGNPCQHIYNRSAKINKWKQGENISSPIVRTYLIEKCNGYCNECVINEWNGKPIVLELEHIDGNSSNNKEENLKMLCPNCHSQTSTYKGRNRGNGRYKRRERYKDGKSF